MQTATDFIENRTFSGGTPEIKSLYLESLSLVERLHRRLLDVIKDEFERRGGCEINAAQALLIYNIGDKELSASELRNRGYYLGANVSYNVKKLAEMGFLQQTRSRVDRRSMRITLTPKGRAVYDVVAEVYEKHMRTIAPLGGISCDDFKALNKALLRLERYWGDQIRYKL
jgi:DNA-binding MarR family transcriptional regulator